MCGLVFAIFPDDYKEIQDRKDILKELLYASALRGDDATGIFATNWDGTKEAFYKRAIPAHDFINSTTFNKILNNISDYNIVMMHTRKATYGLAPEDAGAHPFRKRHVTLVHNGHIQNAHSLPTTKDPLTDLDQTTVDSDILCRSFADAGYKEALARAQGAWAVIWYDESQHTLSLTRNNARPLFFGFVEPLKMIVGGSELPMLDWVLARNGYSFKETPLQVRDILDDKKRGEVAQVVTFREDNFPKYSTEDLVISPPRESYSTYINRQFGHVNANADDDDIAMAAQRAASMQERLRPVSKKDQKRAMKMEAKSQLEALGLHHGQIVDFMPSHWEPYNKKLLETGVSAEPTALGRWIGIAKTPFTSSTGKVLVNFSAKIQASKLGEIDKCRVHEVRVLGVKHDDDGVWYLDVAYVHVAVGKYFCIHESSHAAQIKAETNKVGNIGRILALYTRQQERNSDAKKVVLPSEVKTMH